MRRVFFWSADSMGCGHYRCMVPAAGLVRLGEDGMDLAIVVGLGAVLAGTGLVLRRSVHPGSNR